MWQGLFLAFLSNIDNLNASFALAASGIRLDAWTVALTVLFTGVTTALSVGAAAGMAADLGWWSNLLGGLILVILGLWTLTPSLLDRLFPPSSIRLIRIGQLVLSVGREPILADTDASGYLDWRERVLLSAGLSLNNVGTGLTAGLLHLPVWTFTLQVTILALLTILVGGWAAVAVRRWLVDDWLPLAAGCGLVLYGLLETFHRGFTG